MFYENEGTLLDFGESLEDLGISEFAFPIEKTNSLLEYFRAKNYLILGGDLYIKKSTKRFELFYADWYYEGKNVEGSIIKASTYLSQFSQKDIYVTFVTNNT